jgi:hypothetical protein
VGPSLEHVLPAVKAGERFQDHFKVRHPYVPPSYEAITMYTDTTFLINAEATMLELIGQMVPVDLSPAAAAAAAAGAARLRSGGGGGGGGGGAAPVRGLLFLGSPRCGGLSEMQAQRLYLSDIPLHDNSAAYILLAEQRQVGGWAAGGFDGRRRARSY